MARLGAGTRRKASGILEKRFTLNGKRYSVYGHSTKELTEKESEIREAVKAGLYVENRNITLDQYYKAWYDRRIRTKQNRISTLNNYEKNYRLYISPALGKRKIQRLERREVLELQESLIEKLNPNTINGIIGLLITILNDAERDEITNRNPAELVKMLPSEGPSAAETIHRALTEEEQEAFLNAAKESYYYELYSFLLCTGLRLGEAAALEWRDIDKYHEVIHITKTVTNGGKDIGPPKTKTSIRDIPLTDAVKAVLKMQLEKQKLNVIPSPYSLIFTNLHGGKITSSCTCRDMKRITKKAGINHIGVHALRDTFATRFIEQGGNPQTLKTILGHSSLNMTMDLYAHVLPNTKAEEMKKISFKGLNG